MLLDWEDLDPCAGCGHFVIGIRRQFDSLEAVIVTHGWHAVCIGRKGGLNRNAVDLDLNRCAFGGTGQPSGRIKGVVGLQSKLYCVVLRAVETADNGDLGIDRLGCIGNIGDAYPHALDKTFAKETLYIVVRRAIGKCRQHIGIVDIETGGIDKSF